ncbi:hypothetical protein CYMTET_42698 [Cymbomonas tetramitiformis]|uniref:Uncharacterized protein n=1 Tax=Cymbomonas tetramitiformis TaxID=36881 RepID=A0AAE0C3J7_9CHLO|nr:hypothetical protein CYMTET_42698 [Cymbomonas tetramitiformis]
MLYLRAHRPSSDTAAYVWWKGLSEPVNSFTSLLLIAPAIYAAHEGMSHAYSALFCVLSAASFGNHLTHVLGFHLLDYLCITTLHCVVCMDFYRNHSPWRGWRIGVTLALAVYVWMVMNFERVTRRPALDTPNDKLTEERRYADLGEEDGDTIICAMGDTEALRDLEAGWKALKLPYTTLARRLEAPKLNFKNGFRTRLQECADADFHYFPVNYWTGNILRALSHQEVLAFEKAFDAHCSEGWEDDGTEEEWKKQVVAEEVTCQARPFQCLQVQDTFKHDCAMLGCLRNGKPCKDHGKTLVVGQKTPPGGAPGVIGGALHVYWMSTRRSYDIPYVRKGLEFVGIPGC